MVPDLFLFADVQIDVTTIAVFALQVAQRQCRFLNAARLHRALVSS
jgi:hypothetical protein